MNTAVREAPHHNTLTCYTDYRCRLPQCKERYNAWNRERRSRKTEGRLVDATPVRRHIQWLQSEGVTLYKLAYTTGVPRQELRDFLYPCPGKNRGRRLRTSPETAARILAVTPDNCRSGKTSAVGTRRRIQALAAAGWTLKYVTADAGISVYDVSRLLRRDTVLVSTAKAVAVTFERLKRQRPERNGIDEVMAKRTRNRAAEEKWPTINYWADRMDVIDDPDFEPLYGITRREIVAHDANELMRFNRLNRAAAAERLGVSTAYIDHAFRDYPQYAVEVAA